MPWHAFSQHFVPDPAPGLEENGHLAIAAGGGVSVNCRLRAPSGRLATLGIDTHARSAQVENAGVEARRGEQLAPSRVGAGARGGRAAALADLTGRMGGNGGRRGVNPTTDQTEFHAASYCGRCSVFIHAERERSCTAGCLHVRFSCQLGRRSDSPQRRCRSAAYRWGSCLRGGTEWSDSRCCWMLRGVMKAAAGSSQPPRNGDDRPCPRLSPALPAAAAFLRASWRSFTCPPMPSRSGRRGGGA